MSRRKETQQVWKTLKTLNEFSAGKFKKRRVLSVLQAAQIPYEKMRVTSPHANSTRRN